MSITQFILFIAAAVLLISIPVAGKYFRILNTLLHEVGHVLASLISGGGIYHIHLFRDTSGVAYSSYSNRFTAIFTALAGYPAASGAAFLSYWALTNGFVEGMYIVLMSLLAVSLLLWVRNGFGFFWIAAFLTGTAAVYVYGEAPVRHGYMYLISAILLVESIRSSWIVFYLSVRSPLKAGDASSLKALTGISSRFWGLLFFLQALYIGSHIL